MLSEEEMARLLHFFCIIRKVYFFSKRKGVLLLTRESKFCSFVNNNIIAFTLTMMEI
jgi:hypothetical protein